MPLPRFQKLSHEKQQVLLDAAREEFAARGFDKASLNRIIAAAGVSKGAMYYYFSDKADLFATVVEDAMADIAEAVGDLPTFDDVPGYWSAIRQYLARASAFVMTQPHHAELGRAIYQSRGQSHGGVLDGLVARGTALCEDLLRAGQKVGAVRDDVPLAMLARAAAGAAIAIDGWLAENFETFEPQELMRLADKALELFRDLVSARGDLP